MEEITREMLLAALSDAGQGIYHVTECELRLLSRLTDPVARQLIVSFIQERQAKKRL